MTGQRDNLTRELTIQLERNIRNKKFLKTRADYIIKNSGIPAVEVIDTINLKNNPQYASDRLVYWIARALEDVQNDKENKIRLNNRISDCFSDREIKEYSTPLKVKKFKFPIRWNMIQVCEGTQWIGRITAKELMELRDAQLINYNEKTQRTLKHIENKDFAYYQVYLNKDAVEKISESFESGYFIPNTITLNIPMNADFGYKDGQLYIFHTDKLDIIDGYHRYIALSKLYNQDNSFDYIMELRVVCFEEEMAKQFIWQEDQKTKMKKMDSNSFNQNSPAVQVINYINQENTFRGLIGRNKAIIDQGLAVNLIDKIYFNTRKKINRKDILLARDEISTRLGVMYYSNPNLFEKPWSYEFTVVAFTLIRNDMVPDSSLDDDIIGLTEYMCSDPERRILLGKKGNPVTTRMITRVNKQYDEYYNYLGTMK